MKSKELFTGFLLLYLTSTVASLLIKNPVKCFLKTAVDRVGISYGAGCGMSIHMNENCDKFKISLETKPRVYFEEPFAGNINLNIRRLQVSCKQDFCLLERDVVRSVIEDFQFEKGVETEKYRTNECRAKITDEVDQYLKEVEAILKEQAARQKQEKPLIQQESHKIQRRRRNMPRAKLNSRDLPIDMFL